MEKLTSERADCLFGG